MLCCYFVHLCVCFSRNSLEMLKHIFHFLLLFTNYSGEIAIEFRDFRLDGVDLGQNADCLTSDHLVVEQKIRNLGWRQVRRYCGDWNPRLKAIHVVTQVSGLRIRAFLAPMHKNEEKPRGFVAKVRETTTIAMPEKAL